MTPRPLDMKPTEARALSRLAQAFRGKREVRRVVWPGLDLEVGLQVLSNTEIQQCVAAAFARFDEMKIPLHPLAHDSFEDECLTQVLFRATRDPADSSRPFAVDAEDLRDHSTVDQRAALFEIYSGLQAELNPQWSTLTEELKEGIADALKKEDRARLTAFGSRALATFMLSTASPPSS